MGLPMAKEAQQNAKRHVFAGEAPDVLPSPGSQQLSQEEAFGMASDMFMLHRDELCARFEAGQAGAARYSQWGRSFKWTLSDYGTQVFQMEPVRFGVGVCVCNCGVA